MKQKPLIFCAIDTADLARAVELAKTVGPVTGGLKLGLEFFSAFGPAGIEKILKAAPDAALFLDLKFHDIPNTVAAAIRALSTHFEPAYINVHASGGMEMMRAAKAACSPATALLGVTVLTSLDQPPGTSSVEDQVLKLATDVRDSGLDGVVCSALETAKLRKTFGEKFVIMVPGIRPQGADKGDQRRVMTPAEALKQGATHLVIGRPITESPDPAAAAANILNDITKGI